MDATHGHQYQAFPSFGIGLSSSRLPSKRIRGFRIFSGRALCTESGARKQQGQMPTRVASGRGVIPNISHRSVEIEHSAHQCNADLPVGLGMEVFAGMLKQTQQGDLAVACASCGAVPLQPALSLRHTSSHQSRWPTHLPPPIQAGPTKKMFVGGKMVWQAAEDYLGAPWLPGCTAEELQNISYLRRLRSMCLCKLKLSSGRGPIDCEPNTPPSHLTNLHKISPQCEPWSSIAPTVSLLHVERTWKDICEGAQIIHRLN